MLLECGVESFQEDQQVHGVHKEVEHAVALGMHHGEALGTHQFLALLTEDRGPDVLALVALRDHVDLRCCVPPAMAIDVALPEALHAIVVEAIVASKCRGVILALLTTLLRLNDLTIGDVHEHRLVLQAVASAVHVLEALEAEVVLTVCTEDLWLLDRTRRAEAAASRLQEVVILARTVGDLVQGIGARSAEGHQALVALHG
mmetsp:Transcript_13256/g.36393  ORF Transcript_13256/g.36393 Transcript_13256/m.36393 type:complete len:202 (-) Transcript_13256:409-1014(-)